ncbi:MAG: C-type lectin domain-containing protein [Gammaproteobacteria bacterium]|nr:C-type lectin domain-containing protein [Gammaproteobacteria bacterium]MBU1722603.1 C-type lectin domain-containing protein [Gammaproteobacteria bacterium]MBU2007075.1 C-type lectin domain-containing protein [Gammaproteobacteria bacterium]
MKPLASSIALSLMTGIAVAAAPGGAILQNKVTATYSDIGGKTYTAESNIVEISIREVRTATLAITLGENQQVAMIPSSKVYSVHTLTNNGNTTEPFTLTADNVTGGADTLDASALKIYLDVNGNGVLDGTEGATAITSTSLLAGTSAKLIVESVLPATIAVSDTLKVTLKATDSEGTDAASLNTVNITFKNSNVSYTPVIWQQAAGGNCHAYAGVNKALSYLPAKADAEASMFNGKMGHLATITSAAENTFIKNAVNSSNNNYWIGAKRTGGATSPFAWVTGEAFSYTNWMSGQPDNAGEDALAWRYDGVWHDVTSSASAFYVIEFDIDCPQPEVAVALEGAKDVDCDGTADDAFGTVRLESMYSGECAIMRSRATNNGESIAKGVLMSYTVPQYASYKADTLKFDGAAKTDAADADNGTYVAATKKVQFNAGDVDVGVTSPDAEFSVVID